MGRSEPRARRTRRALHESMGTLMHERPYDTISVQHILDRAHVARSTFYAHFTGKDDLLADGMRELVRRGAEGRALGFSRPLFEHIAQQRARVAQHLDGMRHALVHDHLRGTVEEAVFDALRRRRPGLPASWAALDPRLQARHVAATLVCVLEWWLASEVPVGAREAEGCFLRLVDGTRHD